jgi:hypothetical protein
MARVLYDAVRDGIELRKSPAVWGEGLATPAAVVASGQGSAVEKNLLLLSLLRANGVAAHPLLISRRANGELRERYHSPDQFDHLVVRVEVGGESHLLDTCDRFCPFGTLPPTDLVRQGLLLADGASELVPLGPPPAESVRKFRTGASLSRTGDLRCRTEVTFSGYQGIQAKRELAEKGEQTFVSELLKGRFNGVGIDSTTIAGREEEGAPLVVTVVYRVGGYARTTGGVVRFPTPIVHTLGENPLTSETRDCPVQYCYPWRAEEIMQVRIPSGYRIAELPPDARNEIGAISVLHRYQNQGSTLLLQRRFAVAGGDVPREDYDALRNLYAEMVSADQAEIVLRGNRSAGG